MKKEIREIDKERGIMRVTTADERFYGKGVVNPVTGLPEYKWVPSVTWIAGHYPKGIAFYKWLAERGWDESESLKQAAADKGSKIHAAISAILSGEEVRIDSKFVNPTTEKEEELTLEEVDSLVSFVSWRKEFKPISLAWDLTVFNEKGNYAGTIDHLYMVPELEGVAVIQDFKTGQYIWPENELQVSAYKGCQFADDTLMEILNKHKITELRLELLQIGYRKNKAGYKVNSVDDKFNLFLAAQEIWKNETETVAVKQKDYPLVISPALKVEEVQLEEGIVSPITKKVVKNK